MPVRKEHNRECVNTNIPLKICDNVNAFMDAPSQKYPGYKHREFRHDPEICEQIGDLLYEWYKDKGEDTAQRIAKHGENACRIHLKLDNKTDTCQKKKKKTHN